MSIIILLVILLLTWLVYRKTRSIAWALGAFLLAIVVVPFAADQLGVVMNGGATVTLTQPNNGNARSGCSC